MAPGAEIASLPKKTLKKVESLSSIDDSLLVGNKKLKDLKAISFLEARGKDGTEIAGFRADLLNFKDVDGSLAELKAQSRIIEVATPSVPEEDREPMPWEVDFTKISLKKVIARGTFGTVHRGIYEGQDVAGMMS